MFEVIYETNDGLLHAQAVEGAASEREAAAEVRSCHADVVAILRVRRVAA